MDALHCSEIHIPVSFLEILTSSEILEVLLEGTAVKRWFSWQLGLCSMDGSVFKSVMIRAIS
jgi:hypothetical protein